MGAGQTVSLRKGAGLESTYMIVERWVAVEWLSGGDWWDELKCERNENPKKGIALTSSKYFWRQK